MTTVHEHKTELVGDDYHGLPMQRRPYRSRPKPTGLDWGALTANHINRGPQVDDSVWKHDGKIELITGTSTSSRRAVHTFELAEEYDEHAAPEQRHVKGSSVRPAGKLTDEQRVEIGRRYQMNEAGLTKLARDFAVSVTTIRNTLDRLEIQTRPAGRPS